MNKEHAYYQLLVRTDHEVFEKDFAENQSINSDLNAIYNRVYARALARVRALIDEVRLNTFPHTVTALTISDWEDQYFGFTKPSLPLSQRRAELLIKFNRRISMSIPDALELAKAIAGDTPVITRNVARRGWVLGKGTLGATTTMGGSPDGYGLYLVKFLKPVGSNLQKRLDERLTAIEKAGSRHRINAPIPRWVLGRAPLGINTTLGA